MWAHPHSDENIRPVGKLSLASMLAFKVEMELWEEIFFQKMCHFYFCTYEI